MNKKKILSFVLAIIMIASMVIGVFPISANEELDTDTPDAQNTFAIKEDSKVIEALSVALGEKHTLYVDKECTGWQIYSPDTEQWVNIANESENEITVTYAKLAGLSKNNIVELRCANGTEFTAPVVITLVDSTPEQAERQTVTPSPAKALAEPQKGNLGATPTYTINVKYQYKDGTKAAEDISETFAKSTYVDWDIYLYKALGYAQLLSCDNDELTCTFADDHETLNVYSLNGITKNSNIVIQYVPGLSAYTLKRFFQNASDDEYTVYSKVKSAMTDTVVPTDEDIAQKFDGMTLIQYENATVDVRGNTEVAIFYDRDYHLVSFNSMGGINGPESVYARYGYDIGTVKIPTKVGYTFTGWYSDEACTVPAVVEPTVRTENKFYYAGWEKTSNKADVNIIYWVENADDTDYSYQSTEVKPNVSIGSLFTVTASEIPEFYHEHTVYCYGVSSSNTIKLSNNTTNIFSKLQDGIENGYVYYYENHTVIGVFKNYYLRYNDNWYSVSSSAAGKMVGSRIVEPLIIIDDYYEKHEAVLNCSSLYYFNKSDSITVGVSDNNVNVYLNRTKFTWRFGEDNEVEDSKYGYITAKWGANVSSQYATICNNAFGSGKNTGPWSTIGGSSSIFTNILTHMGTANTNYYKNGSPSSGEARYWLQNIDAPDTPGSSSGKVSPSNYTNAYTSYFRSVSGNTSKEDYIEITGFTYFSGPSVGASMTSGGLNFYYKRNSYNLVLNDRFSNVNTFSIQYQKNLATVSELVAYVPPTPSQIDSHFHFAGWYLNPECTGNKVDLSKYNMPAANMIFYAKWERDIYTVNFYKDNSFEQKLTETQQISYGSKITTVPENPSVPGMNFVGWFYINKDGTEMAFDPDKMTVSCNMELYAKWSNTELKAYFVYYKLKGKDTEVATYKTGMALTGRTIRVCPKIDAELYIGYQESYFPNVSYYDIHVTKEGDNSFTFYYDIGTVDYTVNYLDRATGDKIANSKKVIGHTKITTTEQFTKVRGYLPEKPYRKTVILAYDQENNIDFYYYKSDQVMVTIYYYLIDGDGNITEYGTPVFEISDAGIDYTAGIKTISGYTFNEELSTITGFFGPDGLDLELYYNIKSYPYTIKYQDGNGIDIANPKTVDNTPFGTEVTEYAEVIPGYEVVGDDSITFTIDEGTNEHIFTYSESSVTINYTAVGSGTVSPTTESVSAVSGTPTGSTATPNQNYKLVGWYSDEECENLLSTDATYTPSKTDGLYVSATYYAKFELDKSTLTIENTGMEANETSVFVIKGPGLPTDGLRVVVYGGASVTVSGLTITGEYTVSEKNDWAWKYNTNADKSRVISGTEENKLTFDHTSKDKKEYGAENFVSNLFNLFS